MNSYIMKYNKPATNSHQGWEREALPIGNGFQGMKIFGRTDVERLQFNEKTLWQGGPSKNRPSYNGGNLTNRVEYLKEIQQALKVKDKDKVLSLKNKLVGIQEGYGCYMPFGNLYLEFNHKNVSNYIRGLDLNKGLAYVSYTNDNIDYSRRHYASFPGRFLRTELSSNKIDTTGVSICVESLLSGFQTKIVNNEISFFGQLEDNQMKYYGKAIIETDGKAITNNSTIKVIESTYINITVFLATNYENNYPTYRGIDPENIVKELISKYYLDKNVYSTHFEDYNKLFSAQKIELVKVDSVLYTNELLLKYKNDQLSEIEKLQLEELLFVYGKYLILSSSREGSLPANLQGVWNDSLNPAWGSDYHLNINLQMCYWPVYTLGLFDCAKPLIEYVEKLREPGRITAKEYHGIESNDGNKENGWVCHNQNTPFGWTCPGWSFYWGWSPAASSWILQNCYDYYKYTQDLEMLTCHIYPMMKENVKFWLQNLIYDAQLDKYVSSPSYSPEHGPISQGNTYEQEIIYSLFSDTIEAAKVMHDDKYFIDKMIEIKSKLKPIKIGKWGQIKEWEEEDSWNSCKLLGRIGYKLHSCQFHHRHASHLLGLFPYYNINRNTDAEFNAAKVSLDDRGKNNQNAPGWSRANKAGLYARLKDSVDAYDSITGLIKNNLHQNLWDYHPPYQMDGNCGYTTAIIEMLVYDDGTTIEILPAAPKEWNIGKVCGLRLKNNLITDFTWEKGKVTTLFVKSKKNFTLELIVNNTRTTIETNQLITF